MRPPPQLPASFEPEVPQDTRTCSERLRSTLACFPREEPTIQGPPSWQRPSSCRSPLVSQGVTKFPLLFRQSRLGGAPTMGGSAMTIISAPMGMSGFFSPRRALRSAG